MKRGNHLVCSFLRVCIRQMKALGLNQTTLAKRLKVSRPYVTKLLQGDVNISFAAAERLAKALQLDFKPDLRVHEITPSAAPPHDDVAYLSNDGRMVFFSFGGKSIRFLGAKCLRRFVNIVKWHAGYIEVMADNGGRIETDSIDLVPILENLCIDPVRYVQPIRKVELNYA